MSLKKAPLIRELILTPILVQVFLLDNYNNNYDDNI